MKGEENREGKPGVQHKECAVYNSCVDTGGRKMILHGWTCPGCDEFHRTIDGCRRTTGLLTVKCPSCREIDQIRPSPVVL